MCKPQMLQKLRPTSPMIRWVETSRARTLATCPAPDTWSHSICKTLTVLSLFRWLVCLFTLLVPIHEPLRFVRLLAGASLLSKASHQLMIIFTRAINETPTIEWAVMAYIAINWPRSINSRWPAADNQVNVRIELNLSWLSWFGFHGEVLLSQLRGGAN